MEVDEKWKTEELLRIDEIILIGKYCLKLLNLKTEGLSKKEDRRIIAERMITEELILSDDQVMIDGARENF